MKKDIQLTNKVTEIFNSNITIKLSPIRKINKLYKKDYKFTIEYTRLPNLNKNNKDSFLNIKPRLDWVIEERKTQHETFSYKNFSFKNVFSI